MALSTAEASHGCSKHFKLCQREGFALSKTRDSRDLSIRHAAIDLFSSDQIHTVIVQGKDVHSPLWLCQRRGQPGLHRDPAVKEEKEEGRSFSGK